MNNRLIIGCTMALLGMIGVVPVSAQQVDVIASTDEAIKWLEADDWWGPLSGQELSVPNAMITGISPRWKKNARKLTVAQKKEIFYRFMLPLVLHANQLVLDRRQMFEQMQSALQQDESLHPGDLEQLAAGAELLRIISSDEAAEISQRSSAELRAIIAEALYRLDVIPPGLVLGQAAYESGYGTSRFASEGNALFGQWTYGGQGLVPEQQRENLGDHRIAAFDWPFDSVRGYYINLSSHPAYEDFRRRRAELKASGNPVTSLALADGLIRYSERGQDYVDTLKGIIRVNKLDRADDAILRDEPMRFVVSAADQKSARELRQEIERLRKTGELAKIIARMRLD